MQETVVIIDLGSQYTQLIARRIRECGVYSEVVRFDTPIDSFMNESLKGVILSGGPSSVYEKFSPKVDPQVFRLGVPVLGICYGMQLMVSHFGGIVEASEAREYGRTEIRVEGNSFLFNDINSSPTIVWMSHGDKVKALPNGWRRLAFSDNTEYVAVESSEGECLGIQFHPEVYHTPMGTQMIKNFVRKICYCKDQYELMSFVDDKVAEIREKVGPNDIVICGLSGGVDSAVAASIVGRAVGNRLKCVFVDHGLLRQGEVEEVKVAFPSVEVVDDKEFFLEALAGVTDPEEKRKIIGAEFIKSFKLAIQDLDLVTDWDLHSECDGCHHDGNSGSRPECICTFRVPCKKFLVQGTLYPDVIESESVFSELTDVIKSHHNVGGLPEDLGFELIEPLKMMFKDEVREVGRALGVPTAIVERQPFPGPGLAIRVLGEISKKRLDAVRQADAIVREELDVLPFGERPWQYYAALLPVKSVGVMGDKRTYEETIVVRAVSSVDGMTADFSKIDYNILGKISSRIVNEVSGVNRVVYDITSKPPGTIEWE